MADGNAAAMKEKEQGNAAYKSKNFTKVNWRQVSFYKEKQNVLVALVGSLFHVHQKNVPVQCTTQAIGHYEAAIGLDPTEITFRSNLAAVHFEMKNYEEVNHSFYR